MLVYTVGEIFMKENILPREGNCEKQFHPLHMHANDILNCLLLLWQMDSIHFFGKTILQNTVSVFMKCGLSFTNGLGGELHFIEVEW